MKHTVEARIFHNGRTVTKVRPAAEGETSGCTETRTCDIWVDVFDTEIEAMQFAYQYRRSC